MIRQLPIRQLMCFRLPAASWAPGQTGMSGKRPALDASNFHIPVSPRVGAPPLTQHADYWLPKLVS